MNIKNLDKGSKTPLYNQLAQRLILQINKGELKAGDKIPSERELSESLNVSRITARMAIDTLMEKGLVYREQGKGTYVAQSKMSGVKGFSSFSEDAIAKGLKPSSKIIEQALIQVDEKRQRDLHLDENEQAVYLRRVRLVDDKPIAIQTAYLPHKICSGMEDMDLTDRSLFKVLREEYYIHPAWTEAVVRASLATEEEAELLQIAKGDPVLVVRGLTFTEAFEVVEHVTTVYPAMEFELYMGRQRIERGS